MPQVISQKPSAEYIRTMFDALAPRYDIFNHLTSLGLDAYWRKKTLEGIRPGMRVLDLGCGTGDLALQILKKTSGTATVSALDFSENMLSFARERCRRTGFVEGSVLRFFHNKAEDLPVEDERYDAVVSGFVLRNLYENIDLILSGVHRSLKGGGRISFLDFTEAPSAFINWAWKTYMNTLVALYGRLLFGERFPLFYMTSSAERFVKPSEFREKLLAAGFRGIATRSFMFGIITLYSAFKPE